MLSNILTAVLAFCKKNPAVVSWAATAGAAALAHFGFHASAGQIVAILAIVGSIAHLFIHVQVKKGSK